MTPAWRRLLVPLALSLAGHAVLLWLIGFIPRSEVVPSSRNNSSRPLTISLCSMPGPVRRVSKPAGPKEEWIDIDVVPRMVIPATPSSASIGPFEGPTLHAPGGTEKGFGTGPPATPVRSSYVVVPAEARRVVFLLDRSGSMGLSDALDRAKAELTAALGGLPPEASFQVLAYNNSAWPLGGVSSDLLPATRENVSHVRQQLDVLAASGVTRHVEAMKAALLLRPDLVILLTDADDLGTADVRLMTTANRGHTVIDVVELTRDPRSRPDGGLASLASLNGGRHRRILLGRAEARLLAP